MSGCHNNSKLTRALTVSLKEQKNFMGMYKDWTVTAG